MFDRLFDADKCERCYKSLKNCVRIMSWFTEETICDKCSIQESELKSRLPNHGRDHEGCGYIPEAK